MRVVFRGRYQAGNGPGIAGQQVLGFAVEVVAGREIALGQHIIDHALQAHGPAIIRRINAGDAVLVQFFYFGG